MEDSNQDRQENEKAALKAIYNDQMKDISTSEDDWIPLECILTLGPQGSVGHQQIRTPSVQLHITCSHHYPDEEPTIAIDSCKGISIENKKILLRQLIEKAKSLRGEVVIFELAQHVENFLHQYNQPGFESFYEEMVTRQRSQQEKELQEKQADEERKREKILMEIQSRQQAAKAEKKALRRRRSSIRHDDIQEAQDLSRNSPKHKGDKESHSYYMKENGSKCEEIEQKPSQEELTLWNFSTKGQSRFENEFEHIKWLGKGAFGDVIKVRNKLDDGLYAVKRIQLNPMNIQLNKKITREVKLLSRLNHENVVRYYNSWIESAIVDSECPTDIEDSLKSENVNKMMIAMLPRKEPSLDWISKPSESSEDSSDDECWITFKSVSVGDEVDANFPSSSSQTCGKESENTETLQYMYIQMELCEKSTLRSAIDENLYADIPRVWRLFREIIEGLCHIHQQGIIHRDLKPVNIFIDNDDHVKIGDFGLATTSIWHKQNAVREREYPTDVQDKIETSNALYIPVSQTGDLSQTGQIGTALYVAPELKSRTTKLPYNQKVDIFSLGIIFFEMCHPPLKTGMERFQVLSDLRQKEPIFPSDFLHLPSSPQNYLISWMLKHDAKERPSSQQLLQSEHIPPPELEEAEVREIVRHTMCNPQSKDYKHLIASCFKQVPSPALDATYDQSTGRSILFNQWFEYVTEKFRKVFWRHGAINLSPPFFTPAVTPADTSVCLMTRGGGIVYATYDLRTPFARYLARSPNITNLKRYAMDKVFREKRVHGFHPKEMFECAFDIVTPSAADTMPEFEMFAVFWEILLELPPLIRKNCTIHLNHTHLITAMLRHCGLDQEKQKSVCMEIYKAKNEYRSKLELESHLKSLDLPEHTITTLIYLMNTEGSLSKVYNCLTPMLRDNGLITLCKQGFRHLELIMSNCEAMGIASSFIITLGLMQNAHLFSGIICQVVLDQKTKPKHLERNVIITGGRYDALLQTSRKALHVVTEGSQSVTGFLLSIDKLVNALIDQEKPSAIDVLVCSFGENQMSIEKLCLIKELWRAGIRTSFLSTIQSLEEIKKYCQDLNIPNIVILKDTEPGFARIAIWMKERYQERKIQYNELLEHLLKVMKNTGSEVTHTRSDSKVSSPVESPIVTFLDKPSPGSKRRYENQIRNCVSSTLQRLSNRVRIEIFGMNLEKEIVKKLWFCFESDSKEQDLNSLRDEFPRHKRYIDKAVDLIEKSKRNDHSSILILYSLPDNMFKTLL